MIHIITGRNVTNNNLWAEGHGRRRC